MRLLWVIQVGPKGTHKRPCKREAKGPLTARGGKGEA